MAVVLLCFDVVLATMAAGKLAPQGCLLESHWREMFTQKSKQIQDIQTSVFTLTTLI
jgi:hypothetical protein